MFDSLRRSCFRCHRVLLGLALGALAPTGSADADISRIVAETQVSYAAGSDAANLTFSYASPPGSAVFNSALSGAQPPLDVAAESFEVFPVFTAPSGANGDTLFQPAVLRAYQNVVGFNAASVEAAIADGRPFHRVNARTEWRATVLVTGDLPGAPTSLSLDYLLFPGEAGLTTFGGFVGQAGFRAAISVDDVMKAESVTILQSIAGPAPPALIASGDFLQPGAALTGDVRNGLAHTVIRTEPVIGSAALGVVQSGSILQVSYVLEAWLEIPGFEVGGFARIGDPFELSADPSGYLATQFPGLIAQPFRLREVAPVPLPGSLGLLFGALGMAGAALRRMRGCPRFTA